MSATVYRAPRARRAPRRWIPSKAAGSAVALDLAVAGQGSFAPTLSVSKALQVSVSGQGTLTAPLALQKALQLVVSGQGSFVANFIRQIALALGIVGQGTVAPALSVDEAAPATSHERTRVGAGQ